MNYPDGITRMDDYLDRTVTLNCRMETAVGEFKRGERMNVTGHWRGMLHLVRYRGCPHADRIRMVPRCQVTLWEPKVGERFMFSGNGEPHERVQIKELRTRGFGWHEAEFPNGETYTVADQELLDDH